MASRPEMSIEDYLERMGYRMATVPTAAVLTSLHRAHMLTVPFENLDIPLGREIELDLASFYDKIVRRRRGGFCYELNGLFGWLLRELGFTVTLLSGRVYEADRPGPEFDHMLLLVDLKERMIADVGFGGSFLEPLVLGPGEQVQSGIAYRLIHSDSGRILERRRPDGPWEPQYAFSLTPRRMEEYAAMCRHQQTSPDSVFTRRSICSLATSNGRITLTDGRVIETIGERRQEREVGGEQEYRELLKTRFGIDLGEDADFGRLIAPGRR